MKRPIASTDVSTKNLTLVLLMVGIISIQTDIFTFISKPLGTRANAVVHFPSYDLAMK
jgi:hypothetical protein